MASVKKYTSFGEHLRTLREEAGQTLKTVAEQISIDISLLAKINVTNDTQQSNLLSRWQHFFKWTRKNYKMNFSATKLLTKF